jgi:hypothetical protein
LGIESLCVGGEAKKAAVFVLAEPLLLPKAIHHATTQGSTYWTTQFNCFDFNSFQILVYRYIGIWLVSNQKMHKSNYTQPLAKPILSLLSQYMKEAV